MKIDKKYGIILVIVFLILLMSGGTYAYWVYRENISNIGIRPGVPFNCSADGGVEESTVALAPAECTHSRFAIQKEIKITHEIFSSDTSVYFDMVLNINQIGPGLAASSNFKYVLTTSPGSCTENVVTRGTFTNKTNGSKITLLDNVPATIDTYYLYIWIDAVEENPNVLVQNFNFSLSLQCIQGEYYGDSGSGISGAEMLISKANGPTVTTYSSGNAGEMYTFSQPETEQLEATTDYRYIGNTPNNYITFNDETWRIIGVFDGKIKIIKDTSIGNMSWDFKKSGVGSSTGNFGSNDWVDSQLMYMLNPSDIATNVTKKSGYTFDGTYVKDANNKIIYQKGCQPAETNGESYTCTTNTWGLNDTALTQVADVTYYLGGGAYNSTTHWGTTPDIYTWERGVAKYNNVRSTNWTGKVGLMYLSDYVYTFAYGVDNTCYSDALGCDGSNPSSSWLYNSSVVQWTQATNSSDDYTVFVVDSTGYVLSNGTRNANVVRPVVYLKSDIVLSGSGTSDDKYEIVVPQQTGAEMLISKANDASVTTYSSGDTGEMYTFSQPATTQLAATTDYRYIGNTPNNYITFNNETWRIIGVFDGKIKIIKDTSIGNTTWDYKKSGVGSSTSDNGSNDWVDSQLMYMLNPNDISANVALKTGYTYDGTYVKDANNKIIYQKGCNPSSTDGTAYTCTAAPWSLNATALTQVADVTYYLGGSSTYYGLSAPDYYTFERGETKYNAVRSTNWTGKVGLMYPSDYAYTFAYGVDNTCYSNAYDCDTSTPTSSWLFKSTTEWTLAPDSVGASKVFRVSSAGYAGNSYDAYYAYGVRPVVYLKSDITLTGTGTSSDPYVIGS